MPVLQNLVPLALRISAVVCMALALQACRIHLEVPQGGEITSSSGLYGCVANVECTIVIDHEFFAETFTAVPAEGYTFQDWEKVDGGFCGGSNKRQCGKLKTAGFLQNPALLAILQSDQLFRLIPVFTASEQPPTVPTSVWKVVSTQEVLNYSVQGDSVEEIRASLGGDANPLDILEDLGTKPDGISFWRYNFSYSFEMNAGGTMCSVVSGRISTVFETVIPHLENIEDKPTPLQNRWNNFLAGLIEHEAGHHTLSRPLMIELRQALEQASPAPCDELASRLASAAQGVQEVVAQANIDFDIETNHGLFTIPPL